MKAIRFQFNTDAAEKTAGDQDTQVPATAPATSPADSTNPGDDDDDDDE